MADVEISWEPSPQTLGDDLFEIAAALGDMHEPLEESVNDVMSPSILLNFESGGRPAWVPLSIGTLENCHRGPGGPLLKTRRLESVASSPEIWNITADSAYVDDLPGAEYGGIHQNGAAHSGHGAVIPARPFMLFQPQDEDAIQDIFAKWIDQATVEFWGGGAAL